MRPGALLARLCGLERSAARREEPDRLLTSHGSPLTTRYRARAGAALALLSLAALSALLARGSGEQFLAPLQAMHWPWLGAAIALALGVEALKALRWRVLLGPTPTRFRALLACLLTARLLNAVAPLRAGDVWRLAATGDAPRGRLLVPAAVLLAEKLLDGAALAASGAALAWLGADRVALPRGAAPAAAALAMALLALLAALWLKAPRALAGRVPRGAYRALAQLDHLARPRLLGWAAVLTVGGLGLGTLVNLAALQAVGLPAQAAAGLAMLLAAYAVGLLPTVPAQLGVFELGVSAPLIGLGLAPPVAVAAAVALHLALLSALALGGVAALALGAPAHPAAGPPTAAQAN